MKLVIDPNRIMAGLLKDSTSRKIILNSHSLRKPPGVCDYHAIIIDADLDLGTGLEIIPVDKRIDHRSLERLNTS